MQPVSPLARGSSEACGHAYTVPPKPETMFNFIKKLTKTGLATHHCFLCLCILSILLVCHLSLHQPFVSLEEWPTSVCRCGEGSPG